jgi:uncharacterized protein (DUF433 family)
MIPWERNIYVSLLIKHLEEEKERMVDFAYKYGNLTLQQISDAFDNEYKNEK